MSGEKKYFYGPVPSRRLGLSFGVDIVPFKVCTLDCIYCQLGKSTDLTIERKNYGPIEPILAELKGILSKGLKTEFITIAGSGEPTLNSQLGKLIEGIKKITDIPVAILTNGTLFYKNDVRVDCAKADVVIPSLDAGDAETFQKVNRPHRDINIENLISGLSSFRDEFSGQIWLEVFFVESLNTKSDQIAKIRNAIDRIRPDKVQLNTAVRPTAEPNLKRLDIEKLHTIAAQLGPQCEIIADFATLHHVKFPDNKADNVLSILKRRPCSLDDISSGLGIGRNEAMKYISNLQQQGLILSEHKDGILFFKAI
ncbi:MAG: radical SAM protein [Planctomycetota bacterium]|jgi:wyosine [tRNA(Phe)-imidazoG37] synthetase (radical SAM superfamily)